jgi:hypothetical protein
LERECIVIPVYEQDECPGCPYRGYLNPIGPNGRSKPVLRLESALGFRSWQIQTCVHRNLPLALVFLALIVCDRTYGTTGYGQIVTPDLQPEGELSVTALIQSERIGNPYEVELELGLFRWAEVAIFKGFKPNEFIFDAEISLLQKEPWLLSIGALNWSPHSHVDPQPFIVGGYYTEHNQLIAGAIRAGSRTDAILGWIYYFNDTWRAQIDFQSGSGNAVSLGFTCNLTRDLELSPGIYITNDTPHHVLGFVFITYTFPIWRPRTALP